MSVIQVCGAECGVTTQSSGDPNTEHWSAAIGTPSVVTSPVRTGDRAYRFNATGGEEHSLQKIFQSPPTVVGVRLAVRFDGGLPSGDMNLVSIPSGGTYDFVVAYQQSSGRIVMGTYDFSAIMQGPVVSADTWYVLEMMVDRTADAEGDSWDVLGSVDGTPLTSLTSINNGLTTLGRVRVGVNCEGHTSGNGAVVVDDIVIYRDSAADFGIGLGEVLAVRPNRDGTHVFTGTGYSYNNTTPFAQSVTDVWTYLDDAVVTDASDFIAATTANAGYIEVGFSAADSRAPRFVSLVAGHRPAAVATGNQQTMQLVHGGNTTSVYSNADFGQNANTVYAAVLDTVPGGGAWTQAALNATMLRWQGESDVAPVPLLDAVMFEVEYAPGGAGSALIRVVTEALGITEALLRKLGIETILRGNLGVGRVIRKGL